jgi:hypothetical protein
MLGWAFLGIVLGAAGTEFLRKKKPELVDKVEDAAKRFVDSLWSSKSTEGKAKDK